MRYSLVILLIAVLVYADAKLSWENLSKATFTDDHNLEILKAHNSVPQDFGQLLKSKTSARKIKREQTIFTLYTRSGPNNGVRVILNDGSSLTSGGFNPSKPIFFLTHGYMSSPDSSWVIDMKTAQLSVLDCNFFTIDWSECASTLYYPSAVECVPSVGTFLSEILQFLVAHGADTKNIHLIGHSLGAHIMAQVSLAGIRVSRITGLDPAGPLFSEGDTNGRIDPGDADLVDIIHTSKGVLGYEKLLGHWDFYPNGGHNQPGCILDTCEHSMSHDFYIQTILNNQIYPAFNCDSLEAAGKGDCHGVINYMGVASTKGPTGIYYSKISTAPSAANGNA